MLPGRQHGLQSARNRLCVPKMETNFAANTSAGVLAGGSGTALIPQSFEAEVTLKVGYKYLLCLPEGYENNEAKRWPRLVFLHGGGELGDNLELLKNYGPPKLIASGRKFEAIVACPQAPLRSMWNPHGVMALVNTLKRRHRVDDDRVYLTGLSAGGSATWETMCEYPDAFAAAVPVCGRTKIWVFMADLIKDTPGGFFMAKQTPSCRWIFPGKSTTPSPARAVTRSSRSTRVWSTTPGRGPMTIQRFGSGSSSRRARAGTTDPAPFPDAEIKDSRIP